MTADLRVVGADFEADARADDLDALSIRYGIPIPRARTLDEATKYHEEILTSYGDVPAVLDAKRTATMQARAALAGFELVQMADHSWIVARWGLVRALADANAVDAFLVKVGAPA